MIFIFSVAALFKKFYCWFRAFYTHFIMNSVSRLFQPCHIVPKDSLFKTSDILSKSVKLMQNVGIISNSSNGMFTFLPLGLKVLAKLCNLVDEEMKVIGGQKILLPSLTPSYLWHKTSRLKIAENGLFSLNDRQGKHYILSPTFEEAITNMVSQVGPLTRYQLPLKLYQISSKWRDELKPRCGLLRSREFIMKDMYAFDVDSETSRLSYQIISNAYENIFKRIGIPYRKFEAENGMMGGSMSHEFHYTSDIGENVIYLCEECNYYTKFICGKNNICFKCKHTLCRQNTVEIAHTFLLGTKYSKPLKADFTDKTNSKKFLEMGCYGIGLTRLIAVAVEILSTNEEIRWPRILTPFDVCILPPKAGSHEDISSRLAYDLYDQLQNLNIDTIMDDRTQMTIGKRFVEARKTGYPVVIIVGKKSLEFKPLIEVHDVYHETSNNIGYESTVQFVKQLIESHKPSLA
ncbi:probable proline--tRNA ligase, mitochondrial isoform X1 [Copidosoma floridanum]|uniref:probable proline--tRNA ligase, mitochondrial isoform X1 n=1 Tax=Copidosoma floridanum TaxID=29053 RepID=UPI0006C9989F|nr:probable proline--tRNA ligase, mitochondrial isoform X1 [Copidosoma floridanum]